MTDAELAYRAPRLTRLEIQGFKSFLNRTTFAFEPGITAIVGPNGSGKSNVADAVRWVLGEQGQSALRARKTEDVIFSGGQGRAPAGMAEATLTFDNSEGWLPTEFTEVSVTRRAFRSGENQYLINGRRVRLKDVALLTAGLGQSHVVVGQGLVDAALSLKADERRGIFEHAADLTGLRLKVAEAERNLAETDANTTRLNDILTELEPRLKSLERAARQAKEWQGLRDRLRDLQGAHYRATLATVTAAHAAAGEAAAAATRAAAAARDEAARLASEVETAETRLTAARERLTEADARASELDAQLRRLLHERDLATARTEALARRRADMDDARLGLDERLASVTAELEKLTHELRELERVTGEAREATARHNRELAAWRQERATLERSIAATAGELAELRRKEEDLLRKQAVLAERQTSLAAELERLQSGIDERAARVSTLETDALQAARALMEDNAHLGAIAARIAALAAEYEAVARQGAEAQRDHDQRQQQVAEATTRLDVLRRLQESGAGLHGGVKAVLAVARKGALNGILGTVAELIVVPAQYEVAIEVALGSRLQDLVVERWADAEAAIAHLKRTGTGRATFQPLDTVRGGRIAAPPAELARLAGFHGIAADLVEVESRLGAVAAALLGRTIVVDELATARAALRHLSPGWSVVTLSGEIARTGGSVTGGAATRESGTLGRERELRELPERIDALEGSLAAARPKLRELEEIRTNLLAGQRQAEGELASLRAAAEGRRQQQARLEGWLGELRSEQAHAQRRLEDLERERQRAVAAQQESERELAALQESAALARQRREDADSRLAELTAAASDSERAAFEESRRLAGLEERLRSERRREAGLRAQDRALAEELALRDERSLLLERELSALAAEQDRLGNAVAAGEQELAEARMGRPPLAEAVWEAERVATGLAQSLQAARAAMVERDRERDHAEFALERAAQELSALCARIVDELDVAEPDEILTWQPSSIDMPEPNREAEIARLRERLKRVGYVGDDAVAEYERESAHHAFLREQLADVQQAATALRGLLADLRQTMRSRFDETFSRVAVEFSQAFAILFGGGTAQLVLTHGESGGEPGIEIIAQPPGKRLQNLALLSGGERALTAAALLIAILKVNPVPFCLLDEVDAALDEANVVRFRERLQELARQTQIIVVTHNRGTIEIADTLYGVSMGADGVSQVLSLRMSESLAAD